MRTHALALSLAGILFSAALADSAAATGLPEPLADQLAALASTSPGCDGDVLAGLVQRARGAIEEEVKRIEAALPFPQSVERLSCLTDLFDTNIDFAISVPDLDAVFAAAVSNAQERLCEFAREQWRKVTGPLTQSFRLPDFDLGGIVHVPGAGVGTGTTPLAAPAPAEEPQPGGAIPVDDAWKSIFGGDE